MGGDYTSLQFDLLKIDTQGADFAILEACLPLLHPNSMIVAEYSPYHLYRHGTGRADVERIARRFSSIERINPMSKPDRTDPLSMQQVLSTYDEQFRDWIGYCDLVLKQFRP